MNPLSILHLCAGLISLGMGFAIVWLPKGDRRHRLFGWIYVVAMAISLFSIVIRTQPRLPPFAAYALFMMMVLAGAVGVSRGRRKFPAWRAWHGALMALTLLGSTMAASSILGAVVIGAGNGPAFYRMFNAIVASATLLALGLIATRKVIWGRIPLPRERAARLWYSALVATSSSALIALQWPLAFPT